MKLFFLTASKVLQPIREASFTAEKQLQGLVEHNLQTLLGIRFIASEFLLQDGTRLDTLGITNDLRPAIIEYKKVSNKTVVAQVIDYHRVLRRHKSDFIVELMEKKIEGFDHKKIQWNNIRLICIAPSFDRRSKAVAEDSKNEIELITYRFFDNHTLALQWENEKAAETPKNKHLPRIGLENPASQQSMAGKLMQAKAKSGHETKHSQTNKVREGKQNPMREMVERSDLSRQRIFRALCASIMKLSSAGITLTEMRHYFVFKKDGKIFAFIRAYPQRKIICCTLNLNPSEEKLDGKVVKEGNIGGCGRIRIELETENDLEKAFYLIEKAYKLR